jgi:NAD(P)-dependent dehydrogenase (short-subunit alcohol dehydrogenase family)
MNGKVALVTGCTGGIGSETARELAKQGWTVVASDLPERAKAGQELAGVLGEDASFLELDVTSESSWKSALSRVASRYGRLEGLVNNAGVILMRGLAETSLEDFRRVNGINVEGTFLGMRTFAPLLAETGAASEHGAAIVNLSSIYGLGGQPYFSAYCASKGAVCLLTKSAALEFAALGQRIRVNSVHPGPIDTPLARGPIEEMVAAGAIENADIAIAGIAAGYPGGRIGLPPDVAGAIAFLLSDAARFINGAELPVDYGLSAKAQ